MAAALNSSRFLQLKTSYTSPECRSSLRPSANKSFKLKPIMAALTAAPTVAISETLSRLKQQGKVRNISVFFSISNLRFSFGWGLFQGLLFIFVKPAECGSCSFFFFWLMGFWILFVGLIQLDWDWVVFHMYLSGLIVAEFIKNPTLWYHSVPEKMRGEFSIDVIFRRSFDLV